MASILDRRHLEDVTNYQQQQQLQQNIGNTTNWQPVETNKTLIIDDELSKLDPVRSPLIHLKYVIINI